MNIGVLFKLASRLGPLKTVGRNLMSANNLRKLKRVVKGGLVDLAIFSALDDVWSKLFGGDAQTPLKASDWNTSRGSSVTEFIKQTFARRTYNIDDAPSVPEAVSAIVAYTLSDCDRVQKLRYVDLDDLVDGDDVSLNLAVSLAQNILGSSSGNYKDQKDMEIAAYALTAADLLSDARFGVSSMELCELILEHLASLIPYSSSDENQQVLDALSAARSDVFAVIDQTCTERDRLLLSNYVNLI